MTIRSSDLELGTIFLQGRKEYRAKAVHWKLLITKFGFCRIHIAMASLEDELRYAMFTDLCFIIIHYPITSLPVAEDIDFEFVYALHTFVATVEGQANATKGDTMVLLDDSNSYWWLVRIVKDSSIGMIIAIICCICLLL